MATAQLVQTTVTYSGQRFTRYPIRTHWLSENEDLAAVLLSYTSDRQSGDTIAISEKVAILLADKTVPVETICVRWLGRLLARFIRPQLGEALGLSVPPKMQYVINETGRARILAAAAASALTRPLGIRGVFYRVAGTLARDIDGGVEPHEHHLFPPLDPTEAAQLCEGFEQSVGVGIAIVDMNDFGGSIRATSTSSLPAAALTEILADNPMGQKVTTTPFVIIRPEPS